MAQNLNDIQFTTKLCAPPSSHFSEAPKHWFLELKKVHAIRVFLLTTNAINCIN